MLEDRLGHSASLNDEKELLIDGIGAALADDIPASWCFLSTAGTLFGVVSLDG